MVDCTGGLALVLSGGAARAAYQAGVLRGIARIAPALAPEVLTGVSAGAINTAFLAASDQRFPATADALVDTWSRMSVERVFHVHGGALAWSVARWSTRLLAGKAGGTLRTRGMVDNTPLREFLHEALHADGERIPGISASLARGPLRSIAVTASSYTSGQSITWVQGHCPAGWERPHRRSLATELRVEHVLASAALPLFFPAVSVDREWYGDGGIRLTHPLSPAVHLGADRILAISVRSRPSLDPLRAPIDGGDGYPSPAQIVGQLHQAIFLDQFDADADQLRRTNRMVERMPADERGDLRKIDILVLRPSVDLGELAEQHEPKLPWMFRYLTRGLGTAESRGNDALSLVMFQRDYLEHLIELGEKDALARREDIERFLAP
ncbi:MAG: patatin [Planctomycetota bacterium]|nr:MAG: patatin [Planctomycetota bacterium]